MDEFKKAMDAIIYGTFVAEWSIQKVESAMGYANETVAYTLSYQRQGEDPEIRARYEKDIRAFVSRALSLLDSSIVELKKDSEQIRRIAGSIKIWSVIARLNPIKDARVTNELKADIDLLLRELSMMMELCAEIKTHLERGTFNENLLEHYESLLSEACRNFRGICEKDIYREKFLENVEAYLFKIWETLYRGKCGWLYHGTSILFLRHIQKYGLDKTKVPPGIKKAFSAAIQLYQKYEVPLRGDIYQISPKWEQYIFLTPQGNVVEAARADNLPAFMYDMLNDGHIPDDEKARLLASLPEEDRFTLRAIFRFGRILRRKNRMVTLRVKVDSNFLKYYGFPDILGNYQDFFQYCVRRTSNISSRWPDKDWDIRSVASNLLISINPYHGITDALIHSLSGTHNAFAYGTDLEYHLKSN